MKIGMLLPMIIIFLASTLIVSKPVSDRNIPWDEHEMYEAQKVQEQKDIEDAKKIRDEFKDTLIVKQTGQGYLTKDHNINYEVYVDLSEKFVYLLNNYDNSGLDLRRLELQKVEVVKNKEIYDVIVNNKNIKEVKFARKIYDKTDDKWYLDSTPIEIYVIDTNGEIYKTESREVDLPPIVFEKDSEFWGNKNY